MVATVSCTSNIKLVLLLHSFDALAYQIVYNETVGILIIRTQMRYMQSLF